MTVLRELGRGAMGAVELVVDEVNERIVARKRPFLVDDARAGGRFTREFRVLARLSHPNVVRVFELGEDERGLYFTMEHVDGYPLDVFLNNKPKEERLSTLARILPELVDAL